MRTRQQAESRAGVPRSPPSSRARRRGKNARRIRTPDADSTSCDRCLNSAASAATCSLIAIGRGDQHRDRRIFWNRGARHLDILRGATKNVMHGRIPSQGFLDRWRDQFRIRLHARERLRMRCRSAQIPLPMRLVVVSLPANSSRLAKLTASCAVNTSPSFARTSTLIRSFPGRRSLPRDDFREVLRHLGAGRRGAAADETQMTLRAVHALVMVVAHLRKSA